MSFFHLTLKEVHNFASEIANDFEKLSDLCEKGETSELIRKIINILECLETSVLKIEDMERELVYLRSQHIKALREKRRCEEIKEKMEQECEEIESNYEREIEHLKTSIILLQGKNKQLLTLQQIDNIDKEVLILDQKNIICKLSTDLKKIERKLENSIADNKILNNKIEKLETSNIKLHTQYQQTQKEIFQRQENSFKLDMKLVDVNSSIASAGSSAAKCFAPEFESTNVSMESRQENLVNHNSDIISQLKHEKNDLQDEMHKLNQELITAKMQAKYYKERFLQSNKNSSQDIFQHSNIIHQMFHLFLGAFAI